MSNPQPQAVGILDEGKLTVTPEKKKEQNVHVSLDFGNGKRFSADVEAVDAFKALSVLANQNNLSIRSKEYKYGNMVESIGDKANNSNYFWAYSVNGKMGQIAGDKYLVHPGDRVEWNYTKINK